MAYPAAPPRSSSHKNHPTHPATLLPSRSSHPSKPYQPNQPRPPQPASPPQPSHRKNLQNSSRRGNNSKAQFAKVEFANRNSNKNEQNLPSTTRKHKCLQKVIATARPSTARRSKLCETQLAWPRDPNQPSESGYALGSNPEHSWPTKLENREAAAKTKAN